MGVEEVEDSREQGERVREGGSSGEREGTKRCLVCGKWKVTVSEDPPGSKAKPLFGGGRGLVEEEGRERGAIVGGDVLCSAESILRLGPVFGVRSLETLERVEVRMRLQRGTWEQTYMDDLFWSFVLPYGLQAQLWVLLVLGVPPRQMLEHERTTRALNLRPQDTREHFFRGGR